MKKLGDVSYDIFFEWPAEGVQKGEWRLGGKCRIPICCFGYEDFDAEKINQYSVKIEPIELWAVSSSKITEKSPGIENVPVQEPENKQTIDREFGKTRV